MSHFLLSFDADGEPSISGPFSEPVERDRLARLKYLEGDGGSDVRDFFRLTVKDNTPTIEGYNDAELLLGDTSRYNDQGFLLEDGSTLHWPEEETGVILKSDAAGDIVGEWWPGDDNYNEMLNKFPPNGDLDFGDEPDDQPDFELVYPENQSNE